MLSKFNNKTDNFAAHIAANIKTVRSNVLEGLSYSPIFSTPVGLSKEQLISRSDKICNQLFTYVDETTINSWLKDLTLLYSEYKFKGDGSEIVQLYVLIHQYLISRLWFYETAAMGMRLKARASMMNKISFIAPNNNLSQSSTAYNRQILPQKLIPYLIECKEMSIRVGNVS